MTKKTQHKLYVLTNLPLAKRTRQWLEQHSLPGFRGVPLFKVFHFLYQEAKRNDLNMRASAMTYHFFLALFPSLIFLFTLTAYLPKEWDFYNTLEKALQSVLPSGAKDYLIHDIMSNLRPKAKSSFLSIGFVLAVYFGSEGILAMMQGFDKTYKSSFRKRNWLEKQITAILLTFALGILMIFSVLSIIFGERILRWVLDFIEMSSFTKVSIKGLNYLITFLLFYSVISLVYRYGPAIQKPMKGISPGSLFATFTSIVSSFLFSVFINEFGTYHKIYGAISALIITLVWLRLNTLLLILGFELNAAIVVNRDLMHESEIQKRQLTVEDV